MNTKDLIEYIHYECLKAYYTFPQHVKYTIDDIYAMSGYGLKNCLTFWANKDNEFGNVLWELDYYEELPEDILEIFNAYDSAIDKAITEFCKNYRYKY